MNRGIRFVSSRCIHFPPNLPATWMHRIFSRVHIPTSGYCTPYRMQVFCCSSGSNCYIFSFLYSTTLRCAASAALDSPVLLASLAWRRELNPKSRSQQQQLKNTTPESNAIQSDPNPTQHRFPFNFLSPNIVFFPFLVAPNRDGIICEDTIRAIPLPPSPSPLATATTTTTTLRSSASLKFGFLRTQYLRQNLQRASNALTLLIRCSPRKPAISITTSPGGAVQPSKRPAGKDATTLESTLPSTRYREGSIPPPPISQWLPFPLLGGNTRLEACEGNSR